MLVPGDIILLEPGLIIRADGLCTESIGLKINENAVNGENLVVEKAPDGDNRIYSRNKEFL